MSIQKKEVAPVPKTAEGLRDALFDELNLLRRGGTTPQKARVTAQLAAQIIDSIRVQIQHQRLLVQMKDGKPVELGSR